MGAFEILAALVLSAVVGFQIWLTWRVFQSTLYERKQKIWQAQLIWLLPIIGAGLVFSVLRDDESATRSAESRNESKPTRTS